MKYIIFLIFILIGCGTDSTPTVINTPETRDSTATTPHTNNNDTNNATDTSISNIDNENILNRPKETIRADIVEVNVTGADGNYWFLVSVKSNDTGCEQYANWWEILDANKELLYRRILGHPHVDEQPIVRYAEHALNIQSDDILYIRAHMNNKGYVGDVFKGSIRNGFTLVTPTPEFNTDIELLDPQANECR